MQAHRWCSGTASFQQEFLDSLKSSVHFLHVIFQPLHITFQPLHILLQTVQNPCEAQLANAREGKNCSNFVPMAWIVLVRHARTRTSGSPPSRVRAVVAVLDEPQTQLSARAAAGTTDGGFECLVLLLAVTSFHLKRGLLSSGLGPEFRRRSQRLRVVVPLSEGVRLFTTVLASVIGALERTMVIASHKQVHGTWVKKVLGATRGFVLAGVHHPCVFSREE